MSSLVFDRWLTKPDALVLQSLANDAALEPPCSKDIQQKEEEQEVEEERLVNRVANRKSPLRNGHVGDETTLNSSSDRTIIAALTAMNDPDNPSFEPTILNGADLVGLPLPWYIEKWILTPYIRLACRVIRADTDVVMFTHLLLYFCTSVPSAALLFWRFSWPHGLFHLCMQASYIGTYTLMMHQHIHMRGILNRRFWVFDTLFPYITDPLMGHSWNSYFYHHVKHHHIEGNGPDDLSSTIRYQRDDVYHFLHYLARFYFLIWLDLPLYFLRKGRPALAFKAGACELSYYATIFLLYQLNSRATFVALLLPFLLLRVGLMVGNWGQHALVDHDEPDSDYRSSITLIDVFSNRHCFNDGYHTSHHLNPLRHWREHPVSFMKSKALYASQDALVFHNIDYFMITFRLLMKDYRTLAECMVPIGSQVHMTMEERMALLKSHTRRFSEDEILAKFKEGGAGGKLQ